MARLTPQREREIVEAYEAWDPHETQVEDLIGRVGVTKTTLYNVLARNSVPLKTRGGPASRLPREVTGDIMSVMAETALDSLFRRLRQAEDRVAELEEAVDSHPRCKHSAELRQVLTG